MNRRSQVPTILIFLAAILLVILALFAQLTFKNNFKSQSQLLSEMMQEIKFNKQYVLTQSSLILKETENSCFSCSANEFKSRFQDLAASKKLSYFHEGAGNFYKKINEGDFTITKSNEAATLEIRQVFVQSQRGHNKIKRFFDIKLSTEEEPPEITSLSACRAHFTGVLPADESILNIPISAEGKTKIWREDEVSNILTGGEYPNNSEAYPKAIVKFRIGNTIVVPTLDGIAISNNTRVIIYSEPDFKGNILLDIKGPIVIYNVLFKDGNPDEIENNKIWKEPLQSEFPPKTRIWSDRDMIAWEQGSTKIICPE